MNIYVKSVGEDFHEIVYQDFLKSHKHISFPTEIPSETLAEYDVYRVEINPPEGQRWVGTFINVDGLPVPVYEDIPESVYEAQRVQRAQEQKTNPETLRTTLEIVAQTQLATAVKAGTLTGEQIAVITDLYPHWEPGKAVVAGGVLEYQGKLYEVVQSHTTQADWTPPAVPALFTLRTPAGVVAPWRQPLGAHDAYSQNTQVTHVGQTWLSDIDANVWEPPLHWTVVE
jgi:hypothetical protein